MENNGQVPIIAISIRAPARGATLIVEKLVSVKKISIRAPARGATMPGTHRSTVTMYFNPRSREGSDYHFAEYLYTFYDFNPRSREGSDYCAIPIYLAFLYFNPRSREGSD